jgi:hypothetical protein
MSITVYIRIIEGELCSVHSIHVNKYYSEYT